ncbi:MAG: DNA recombination protein RmuC [Chitinophagaceae bacterium]
MPTDLILYLCVAAAAVAIGYLVAGSRMAAHYVPQAQHRALQDEVSRLKVDLAGSLTKAQVAEGYVVKAWFEQLQKELVVLKAQLQQKEAQLLQLTADAEQRISKEELERSYVAKETFDIVFAKMQQAERKATTDAERLIELNKEVSELQKENDALIDRFTEFRQESEAWHLRATEQFKNLATDILKEKSQDFVETNKVTLDHLLSPLKTDISQFKKTIEDTRKEDIQDLTSLKKEIEALQKLNNQLSEDAQKLAGALKSDVKVQGDWGEDRLKYILEAEGLQRYTDYSSQGAYKDMEEGVLRKPDFIINLPDGKHIIIDSKVSLNAYVEYFNCSDEGRKRECLKQLVRNINDHIDGLSAKNYHLLNGLNAPDFVCMFMHFEPALSMAMNECPDILQRAMNKKIVILTPTTLVATAKMIRMIWQKENRAKNVEVIFKQCGLLYDKFVSFVEDFETVGHSLQTATNAYGAALDRLKEGKKKGDTILGRFENIKKLEARTNKSLPAHLLNEVEALDGAVTIDVTPVEE